jgi:hypothetical protein
MTLQLESLCFCGNSLCLEGVHIKCITPPKISNDYKTEHGINCVPVIAQKQEYFIFLWF